MERRRFIRSGLVVGGVVLGAGCMGPDEDVVTARENRDEAISILEQTDEQLDPQMDEFESFNEDVDQAAQLSKEGIDLLAGKDQPDLLSELESAHFLANYHREVGGAYREGQKLEQCFESSGRLMGQEKFEAAKTEINNCRTFVENIKQSRTNAADVYQGVSEDHLPEGLHRDLEDDIPEKAVSGLRSTIKGTTYYLEGVQVLMPALEAEPETEEEFNENISDFEKAEGNFKRAVTNLRTATENEEAMGRFSEYPKTINCWAESYRQAASILKEVATKLRDGTPFNEVEDRFNRAMSLLDPDCDY